MEDLWPRVALLGTTATAGIAGIVSGFGFRKGIPLLWRAMGVVLTGMWLALVCVLLAIYASDAPMKEDIWYWLHAIGAGFLVGCSLFGIHVILAAIVGVAICAKNYLISRDE